MRNLYAVVLGIAIGSALIAPFQQELSRVFILQPINEARCEKANKEIKLVETGKIGWQQGVGCVIVINELPRNGTIKGIIFNDPRTTSEVDKVEP